MATVGLLCGGSGAAKLLAAGCVALYDDPADLLKNYDSSPLRESKSSRNRLFFMGLGVGAAVGILFAPKSGSEARYFVRSKSEEGTKYARHAGIDAKSAMARRTLR
jgi:hypothetical protein